MFSNAREDKNHLAILAIPVILSIVFGFAGEARAGEFADTETAETVTVREAEEKDAPHASGQKDSRGGVQKDLLEQTLITGNYEQFLQVAKGTPFAEVMTREGFDELIAQYKLRKSGYTPSSPNFYV